MRRRMNAILPVVLFGVVTGIASCRTYAGFGFHSRVPRIARSYPSQVMLITHHPRRSYIELGVVKIKPKPWMSRRYVENKLRKKAARMGADAVMITVDTFSGGRAARRRSGRGTMIYRKRIVAGVAIRFR